MPNPIGVDSIIAYPESGPIKEVKSGATVKNCRQLGVLLTNKKTGQFEGFYLNASAASSLQAAGMAA